MRKIATVLGIAGALGIATAPVALAAQDDTTVSIALTEGGLTISAPESATLESVSAQIGSVSTGSLGTVTVEDGRGSLLGWSVTAVATTATMATADATPKTIDLTPVGPLAWSTGTVTATGASLLSGVAAGAGGFVSTTPIAVATSAIGAGGGTFTYTPSLTFTVPANAQAGTYSVVVRQTIL